MSMTDFIFLKKFENLVQITHSVIIPLSDITCASLIVNTIDLNIFV